MGTNKVTGDTAVTGKLLREIKKLKEAIKENTKSKNEVVSSNSPYAPDRKTIDPTTIKGSSEEKKWKEVLTFDQMGYRQLIKISQDDEHRKVIHDTMKKLNII